MNIGLIDVDSHNYPNLPLMKISAWHKQQGDSVEWYEPMFSGHMDIVYMSKVFSFSPDYEYCIDADKIFRGGSGYAIQLVDGKEVYDSNMDHNLPPEIEHIYPDYSLYPTMTKDTAYGFLTRGCPRGCSFCHVAAKEGRCSRKVADLTEFWNGQKNIVLCDPNILACKDRMQLLQQLVDSNAWIDFNQGLDVRLINEEVLELLKRIKIKSIHFAYDDYKQKELIEEKLRFVHENTKWNHSKTSVYILTNFDTSYDQDIERVEFMRKVDMHPYVMVYDKKHANVKYRMLQRYCNPFIFWKLKHFSEYKHGGNNEQTNTTIKR